MLTITEKKSKQCQICKKYFKSSKECIWHVKKDHNIKDFESYILLVYFNNQYPVCKCGCNTKLAFKGNKLGPFFSDYAKNHWPRKSHTLETINKIRINTSKAILEKYGVNNVFKLKEIKEKIKNINIEKYGVSNVRSSIDIQNKTKQTMIKKYGFDNGRYCVKNTKTSNIEKEIAIKLNAQHKFILENHEYDILLDKNIIEIDGDFWHPGNIENLTLSQINNVINDYKKIIIAKENNYNLYKIHISKLPEDITLNNIIENSYIQDFNFKYSTPIINKNYFKDYVEKKGKIKLEKYINLLLRFIRTFQVDFPYPECTENLQEVINSIQNNKLNIYNKDTKTFNNNTSTVGHNYLKSHFKSYWGGKYNRMLSPVEAWGNNEIMFKTIKYRIGLNDSNEVFDFSMKNLVKGLQVRKIGISFFKPILANSIYKEFLGNKENPVVIDPCAGFGARMLGFKSSYPDGTYIGIEPNIDTYNELLELGKNFTNIKLYNCKLEDYIDSKECDLTFTSIPYFNTEIYSNNIEYNSLEEWQNTFIKSLLTFNNLLVNIPENLENLFNNSKYEKYFIQSPTIHFSKNKEKRNELLLKML